MAVHMIGSRHSRADFFDFNLKFLLYVGLWHDENWSNTKKIIYRFYEITLLIFSILYMIITAIGLYLVKEESIIFFTALDKNIPAYNYVLKIIVFFIQRKYIRSLVSQIIYSGDQISETRKKLMIFHVVAVTMMIISLIGVFQVLTFLRGELPVDAWFPFDHLKNKWTLFLATQILVILFTVPCMLRGISIQGIVCSIIMYLCDQLSELQIRLKSLNYSVENEIEIKEEFKSIIKKHIRLMGYANALARNLKEYFLIQNLAVTAELCLNALMASMTGLDQKKHLMTFLAFLVLALCNAYIFCYLGNKLMDESTGIALAAYESSWISWPLDMQKDLLLVITAAQRSFKLTAGGIAYMSMPTFAQALYNGYSVFAVLRDVIN